MKKHIIFAPYWYKELKKYVSDRKRGVYLHSTNALLALKDKKYAVVFCSTWNYAYEAKDDFCMHVIEQLRMVTENADTLFVVFPYELLQGMQEELRKDGAANKEWDVSVERYTAAMRFRPSHVYVPRIIYDALPSSMHWTYRLERALMPNLDFEREPDEYLETIYGELLAGNYGVLHEIEDAVLERLSRRCFEDGEYELFNRIGKK